MSVFSETGTGALIRAFAGILLATVLACCSSSRAPRGIRVARSLIARLETLTLRVSRVKVSSRAPAFQGPEHRTS
jgi:hypothetical protein